MIERVTALGLFGRVDTIPDGMGARRRRWFWITLLCSYHAGPDAEGTAEHDDRRETWTKWTWWTHPARPHSLVLLGGQSKRDVFARVSAAAHGYHDVLLAVDHVRHRRAALLSRQVYGTDFLSGGLVVRVQQGASGMIGCC